MKFDRKKYLTTFFLLGALALSAAASAAAANSCHYNSSGSGIGGTGISGSGNDIAKGTGMGGTGISPQTDELQLAGNVISSDGSVEAQINGQSRLLAKGDAVCVGETILTSQSGMVEIRMRDEGLVAVRPQTKLKIGKFTYEGTDKDFSLLELLKGSARFVTGKLGKQYPQNDLVTTPNAIIGVRGTDHEATVILPEDSRGVPVGTYDKVNFGITFIRTEKGELDIYPNQMGFAVSPEEMPILLKDMPDFYPGNPAMREGDSSESGHGVDHDDNKREDSTLPHLDDKAEPAKPAEMEIPYRERPESPVEIEHPGVPNIPEMPHSPSVPEMPEHSN